MSENSIVLNNGQMAIINVDLTKLFIWNNRYADANYTNSTYDNVTLKAGTLVGKVSATQEIKPLVSTASDGSQYPVGILAEEVVIAAGAQVSLSYCVAGDVAQEKVVLDAGDTMDTVISGRSIYDRIGGDTVGIKLVLGTQFTDTDNQ